mmetsp:Transcript_12939/g.27478  ORF Transcript_12939/g.27478 Transcript_12939/m.27478 type:complete len:85 (-) Transcript_12939:331-585(-)
MEELFRQPYLHDLNGVSKIATENQDHSLKHLKYLLSHTSLKRVGPPQSQSRPRPNTCPKFATKKAYASNNLDRNMPVKSILECL